MRYAIGFVVLLSFLAACAAPPETAQRPNVLVIVTDDQGYADLGAYAHSAAGISTPNMDRIARGGVLFTQAYVSAPVCSPSRAGWNTGRYQQPWDPEAGWNPGLPDDVATIAEFFQQAGYATGKAGKNDYADGYHQQDVREYPSITATMNSSASHPTRTTISYSPATPSSSISVTTAAHHTPVPTTALCAEASTAPSKADSACRS